MSVFPFTVQNSALEKAAEEQLPLFQELAYDYENNCLKRRGGKPYLVKKDEALQIWIYKALQARRFVWPAYTHDYGSELESVIGFSNAGEIIDSETKRYITETLMVNPYLQELSDFTFIHEGDKLFVGFEVITVYGRFTYETEIYNE